MLCASVQKRMNVSSSVEDAMPLVASADLRQADVQGASNVSTWKLSGT